MLDRLPFIESSVDWEAFAYASAALFGAIVIALLLHRMLFAAARRLSGYSDTPVDELVIGRVRNPVKWAMVAISITMVAQAEPTLAAIWEPLARFLRPALLGWIAYTFVKGVVATLEFRLESSEDPVAERSRRTRIAIFGRTVTFVIVFVTIGLMLLNVPGVRDIGTTLLASAGLAALAVGAAAQPALKSLIAGLQMALSEPIRIGDMVVVDGHTGRVEEIRMSFVIVRTWDERAIIVPTTEFLDKPFENWSRRSEVLTGPVFLHLDPATDIEPIREEFERFVSAHPLWDQRTVTALLTEAYPESIELRLAVSARTIGDLWNLRCAIREHMIAWLRDAMPGALIRHRLEVESANERVPKS